MKKFLCYILLVTALTGCTKLDLNPLSEPATESFYSNQNELELAVNDLYRADFLGK